MAGQVWAVNSLGGHMYSDNLSKVLRHDVQPMVKFRQFCDVKNAFGKSKGENFHWDVYSNINTKGGTLVETNTMPEGQFTIVQGTLTVTEYGNSVPYSGKLDDLSEHPIKQVISKVLKHDVKKTMDVAAHAQFNQTPLRVVPTAGTSASAVTLTTNGTATLTNNVAFGNNHAKAIVDLMKERNIPPYIADDYYSLGWPTTYRTFKNNLEQIYQYSDPGFGFIANGEIGRYENARYVEQTHIPKGGAADSATWDPETDTQDLWDNGLSDWLFFFGEDTVAEGISNPEEMRGKIPTDFGRSKGIAWYYIGGFGIVHVASNPDQARIVKWDSAS